MIEELKQLREALRRVKYEAASLADAQVIALEALTQRPAAQAGEREAKCQTCNGHGLVGGHMQDGSGYGEGCPDCNPEPTPLVKWASTQPAAQADEPSPEMIKAAQEAYWPGREVPSAHCIRRALKAALTLTPQQATPEPVGEVVWYDPKLDHFPRQDGHKIIDASMAFMEAAPLGTKLFTRPAPGVPEIDYQALIHAAWGKHKYAQGTRGCIAFKHGAEWFRGVLAAAQAKGGDK